jgi:hypothetical protein
MKITVGQLRRLVKEGLDEADWRGFKGLPEWPPSRLKRGVHEWYLNVPEGSGEALAAEVKARLPNAPVSIQPNLHIPGTEDVVVVCTKPEEKLLRGLKTKYLQKM